MRSSRRLERIPPYLFAELERKVSAKRAAGIDVISLGIGDPDMPTFEPIVAAAQRAVADPSTHGYPTNRGRQEFREAVAEFYVRRFGVSLDPETEVMPAIGAKECIFNLNLAFLDSGDVALAADPGYPVYTGGPLLAGAEPVLMPLLPELGFAPDLDAIPPEALDRARLLFFNYPNNPTGAVVPSGLFEQVVELAGEHQILAVHDNAYSETTFDGYVVPRHAGREGGGGGGLLAVEGLQHDGLALRRNRRQRGGDRSLLATQVEHRLGGVRSGSAGGRRRAIAGARRAGTRDERDVRAPPRPGLRRARAVGRGGDASESDDLHLGARA
jgi:LL-diaminopimelate aminotransferase